MHAPFLLFAVSFGAALLPPVSARPASCGSPPKPGRAIYMIRNDQENAVIAVKIAPDGSLSGGTSTSTGGAGLNSLDEMNQPAVPDALVSQSALTIAGNRLFAVNAGSNSVTMFAIDPADPTQLTMIGQPVDVLGEFPNTVAASSKNKLVCVGSSGAKAGVSCAPFSCDGIGAMDALRPFGLNQSTPPVGPANTVSQAFFSGDENTLFTTVKGDPAENNTGFLAAFPVTRRGSNAASVAQQGVQSSPEGTAVLFGSSTIPGTSDIIATDASFGAAILAINPSTNSATVKGKGDVQGQEATCWVTVSPATQTAFVSDVAVNRMVEVSLADASIQRMLDLSANGDPGLIDLRAAGNFVYALSPGNGTTEAAVTVVDAVAMEQVQHFVLKDLGGLGKNAQGMAVLI